MVQQYFKDLEVVVAQHGVMKCRLPPSGPLIRVNTTFEQPLNPLIIVPVGLGEQNHPEALLVELPALYEDLQGGAVLRFRRMLWRFLVLRIRAAIEQQAGQLRMVVNSGGTVDRALPLRMRLVILLHPPRTRARAPLSPR